MAAKTYRAVSGLDDSYVGRIVDSILSVVPAEAIYLFGSYARGEQTPDSDVDLYVVTEGTERPLKTGGRIRRNLLWMSQPRDILCADRKSYESRKDDLSCVEHQVSREGVLLYG